MKIIPGLKLDFDDVLLVPQLSDATSRNDVDLFREFSFPNSSIKITSIPVIVANMDTVGTFEMARTLAPMGLMVALHKHYEVSELVNFFQENLLFSERVFYSMGIGDNESERLQYFKKLYGNYPTLICIDVANGYTRVFLDFVKNIRNIVGQDSVIMAGNVVTQEMAVQLILSGCDIVKAGIGQGSVCETRLKTGVGYPQASAIQECSFGVHGQPRGHVCGDGGCKTPGDIAKAFAFGADFVMIGGMFSGTDQCEGDWEYNKQGEKIKFKFYGMSSEEAQKKHGNGLKNYRASEGRCVAVDYKGRAESIVQDICGGLRSTCTYVGAKRIKDIHKCAEFCQVTNTHNRIFENNNKEQNMLSSLAENMIDHIKKYIQKMLRRNDETI